MLNTQEIANYLQTGLDEIGKSYVDDPYEFSILAETAKGYDGRKVNGMVKTVSPELAPVPAGYTEAKYVYAVEMFVSGPEDYYYQCVNGIVNKFIAKNQSSNVAFENGKGVVTFSLGVPKGYKIEYELGEGVPLTFTVRVTYTENGVASGDKHWLLDGTEIPFLSENVSVEREGITRKVYTEVYSKTLLTGQTKFYTFRIPYESTIFKSLQAEILQSPAVNAVEHTLTYYDGAAFTEDKPFTTKVTIFRSGSSSSARPDGSAFEVTFTDVYDAENQPLKYELALIDFPFDMNGDDTRYFESVEKQTKWFEGFATTSSAPFITIPAPNLEGVVITKQVYRLSAPTAISQFDLAAKNYAIIKVTSATETLYFYYFIQNSTIGADGCVLLDLKMDTVQTYFFKPEISFSDCLIERAHLNRFVPAGGEGNEGKVKFVTDPASKIYNSEEGLNFPKRLVDRQKLRLRFTGNDAVDDWLNENVAFWVYVFISPTGEYQVAEIRNNYYEATKILKENRDYGKMRYSIGFDGETYCISYPIYYNANLNSLYADIKNVIKINSEIAFTNPKEYADFIVCSKGREYFESVNPESATKSYYYSIKLSIIPPFDRADGMRIDTNNNLIIEAFTYILNSRDCARIKATNNTGAICTMSGSNRWGLFWGSKQSKTSLPTFEYELSENVSIEKDNIINAENPELKFNPKLNGQNFKELVITAASGDNFAYDLQKLNNDKITFEYTEPITPEITKYYLRVAGGTGLYEEGTDENYTGLVGSTDNSLAFVNSKYAEFLANNKNFYLQSNMKIVSGVTQSVKSGIRSGSSGGPAGMAAGVVQGLMSGVSGAITEAIDRSMTIDNLKAAPDELKNANGSAIFNLFSTTLGLFVEKYEALQGDLETANNYMNQYGFMASTIANVRNFVNIRRYHNYIKAQLQSINGNLSNAARADLRQRFANGVRFWNIDEISYNKENYELWLE